MTLLIDTALVPASDRVEYWSEASWNVYHPLAIQSGAGERFTGRMSGHELGPLALFRIATAANTMSRTAGAIAAGDPECIHVSVMLRGRLQVSQQDRTTVVRAGDVMSYETSRPMVARAEGPFEAAVLQIPRDLLGDHAGRICSLTAVRIPGNEGLARVAARFVRELADGLADGTIGADDGPTLAECALDLTTGLYASRSDASRRSVLRTRDEIRRNIESFIEENLGDPGLDPETVARASFISTRYLHKLFEAQGVSVCQWIRERRLERCRRDLLDPALREQTILAIATRWGLPGPQHFSRLFRAAYGCSPSELRRDALPQ